MSRSPLNQRHRRLTVFLFTFLVLAWQIKPVMALDLQFSCQANSSSVFQVVSQVATQMSHWAWVDIVEAKHTIKTFVRNWRNIGTPVWIQVRERRDGHDSISELHILWEQTLDPLNYPDLYDFLDGFAQQQKAQGLGCTTLSTDVGL